MKNKCELSLAVAEFLSQTPEKSGWTASIHCSYYAVFQYMKYLLAEKAQPTIPYARQDSHSGTDSHTYVLLEIKNRIKNANDARKIADRVKNLKHFRIEADYHQTVFSQAEALGCKSEADGIIRNLTNLLSA